MKYEWVFRRKIQMSSTSTVPNNGIHPIKLTSKRKRPRIDEHNLMMQIMLSKRVHEVKNSTRGSLMDSSHFVVLMGY